MVYAASTRSLATLEMAVHLDRSTLLDSFVLIPCRFDEHVVVTIESGALPANWRRDPPPPNVAAIGDAWAQSARSVVLAVPSAVIEEEVNYLLNPRHPQFAKIKVGRPQNFAFDQRLIK